MKFAVIVALMCVLSPPVSADSGTRHTNIKCEIQDESFAEVNVCRLKILGRGIIGANVHLKIKKLPVKTVKVNFSVWKKLSGYHPFLFNTTVDLCHNIKHPNPSNVFYYFYGALKPFLNVNHSCPINHDLILKDFVLDDMMFSLVPVPKGNYMFDIKLWANGAWRATIFSYLDIKVDKTL
ncbi:uncharacterized protein LOC108024306 [Drosophila biarmipes]|uniref:uncharacterized protein LOC108024306 n=1 Tax=Drosophila biarmipes TaxID=125945 RepID=UPI001CDA7133|nr:uncharacterized protein LOC108024306 [Drosophila biarmipes]